MWRGVGPSRHGVVVLSICDPRAPMFRCHGRSSHNQPRSVSHDRGDAMTSKGAELFDCLRSLGLPDGEYAVFGSGPLIVRGVIEATNDLDVVSRGAAWERACELGELVTLVEYDVDVVSFLDGAITIGRSWAYGDVDIDEVIDTAEVIDGLPFVRLEHVAAYKKIAGRPKDLEHLGLMESALRGDVPNP